MPRTPFSTTVRVVNVHGRYFRAQLRILADLARWQKKESPTPMSLNGYFSRRLRAGGGMFLSIFGRRSSLSSDIMGPLLLEIAARRNCSGQTSVVVLVRELQIKQSYRTSHGKQRMYPLSHRCKNPQSSTSKKDMNRMRMSNKTSTEVPDNIQNHSIINNPMQLSGAVSQLYKSVCIAKSSQLCFSGVIVSLDCGFAPEVEPKGGGQDPVDVGPKPISGNDSEKRGTSKRL